jgi:type II secretory pathway component GspD/PulD (secretin)
MLAKLLDGGQAAQDSQSGTLVNGFVGMSAGSLLGSLVTTSESTMTLTTDTMTVISDSRLNRLIFQGSDEEIQMLESYLAIIDKEDGITDVQTYGQTRVFELIHANADETATVIRETFAGRVVSQPGSSNGSAGDPRAANGSAGSSAAAARDDDRSKSKATKAAPAKTKDASDLEPKMIVAAHSPSNSVIVTAPQALMEDVQSLIDVLDERSEETIQILMPSNLPAVEAALQSFLNSSSSSSSSTGSSSRSTSSKSNSGTSRDSKSKR